ncbi:YifB family Mg chelatase-like AAA ATPase [Paracandidimonas soli]|uniref:Magnesium chelatase family protein n=1 Tax=Paracandidimonas soli TaxID=1917182 RepID=A0A4R3UPY3_9BURK|nr:YifB family Mg chelatase-like AAA ATPase [Paracandidimonas soli]TCU92593.1 magnesium chelatase family protein [Paracandidimonas soli]
MSLAVLSSCALRGLQALCVRVEVHVGTGLPSFQVVGLPDAEVRESRERVRAAIVSSGFSFPSGRVTVNLAPADLPKESGRFDLPIALGVMLASGQIAVSDGQGEPAPPDVQGYVFAGELSLTGAVVPVSAPLAIALGVRRLMPDARLVLPEGCAGQAAMVPGLKVLSASCLAEVVAHFSQAMPLARAAPQEACDAPGEAPLCLSDVQGQGMARRVLELAAAGGHSLLMSGSPGVGKSMLAQRLPGLLPDLSIAQALDVAALHGLTGRETGISLRAPFRTPHHSASVPALVGGGAIPRPGEISMANHGVLFLDELPEFDRRVLESLREPMETGHVSIARARGSVSFPADFQLVAAMNPCPCGWFGHKRRPCTCTPDKVQRYRDRLSGPLLDRIDLQIGLPAPDAGWLELPAGEASRDVRARVLACRELQLRRQGGLNARLGLEAMKSACRLSSAARGLLTQAMERWDWSGRVVHRVMRVSRTIADMAAEPVIDVAHVAEAIQYRQPW